MHAITSPGNTTSWPHVYFTRKVRCSCGDPEGADPANRVSRFVLGDDDRVDPDGETVIIDHIVSPREHHIAGDLEFGSDGYLYVTVGDGVCSLDGRNRCGGLNNHSLLRRLPHGKILRVNRHGIPPATNPYAGLANARRCTRPAGVPDGTGPCKEIFASGFRNPFRFARKPGTSTFFVNDVGQHTWEEVDRLARGKNYGWNVREGHCARGSTTDCGPAAPYTNPIHDYQHDECRSITGGAFVPDGLWPGYDGSYLYADFACGNVFRLVRDAGGGFTRSLFMTGADGPVHLRFGPYGEGTALFHLSYFGNTVHRITFTQTNTAPVADFTYVPGGQVVAFSGAASYDPDSGDHVASWAWDFGDGTTAVTTGPSTVHTYAESKPCEVRLTVTDSRGLESLPTTKTVYSGEHPPTVCSHSRRRPRGSRSVESSPCPRRPTTPRTGPCPARRSAGRCGGGTGTTSTRTSDR